ncbi:hypothetical protein NUKP71_47710 [Klebsiella quasipneumoniae]|nr:hypothetical protein NUKP71_47710 [Klebsiella quasipneumoniae]
MIYLNLSPFKKRNVGLYFSISSLVFLAEEYVFNFLEKITAKIKEIEFSIMI